MEKDLRDVFTNYGHIADVNFVMDQNFDRSFGFAFVSYERKDEVADAKYRLDVLEIDESRLRVDFFITKVFHTPTTRS